MQRIGRKKGAICILQVNCPHALAHYAYFIVKKRPHNLKHEINYFGEAVHAGNLQSFGNAYAFHVVGWNDGTFKS